jgi:polar amino acid transport system substrate-binding protein
VTQGVLRAGINLGNALLAGRDPATGEPRGIAVDLARALGQHLGVDVELVTYQSAARMADAAAGGAWDAAFLAADAARADIDFTEPYLEIDATYLVDGASPLREVSEVDRTGVRIAVSDKSAYDLALRRAITLAQIVPAPTVDASVDVFFAERLDVLAGLRPLLVRVAEEHPGCRVLEGRFTAVRQAIGTPKGRDLAPLAAFVRHARTSGLIGELIDRHGVRGVTAAS